MRQLNQYLQVEGSPATEVRPKTAFSFETGYEVQGRKIRVSQAQIRNFVKRIEATAGPTTIGSGVTLYLTSTLDPQPPFQNVNIFAHPYINAYEGTVGAGSMYIWPDLGVAVTDSNYKVEHGFIDSGTRGFTGVNEAFMLRITNNSSGSKTLYFETEWRYLNVGIEGA